MSRIPLNSLLKSSSASAVSSTPNVTTLLHRINNQNSIACLLLVLPLKATLDLEVLNPETIIKIHLLQIILRVNFQRRLDNRQKQSPDEIIRLRVKKPGIRAAEEFK